MAMSPMTPQNFRQRQEAEVVAPIRRPYSTAVNNVTSSAPETLFTVPDGYYFEVVDFSVCNIEGATLAVTVSLVPDGGSASASNRVYDAYPVAANDSGTLTAVVGRLLEPGEFIVASVDGATGGNFWLSGYMLEGTPR